jgi:hypothetical protein
LIHALGKGRGHDRRSSIRTEPRLDYKADLCQGKQFPRRPELGYSNVVDKPNFPRWPSLGPRLRHQRLILTPKRAIAQVLLPRNVATIRSVAASTDRARHLSSPHPPILTRTAHIGNDLRFESQALGHRHQVAHAVCLRLFCLCPDAVATASPHRLRCEQVSLHALVGLRL